MYIVYIISYHIYHIISYIYHIISYLSYRIVSIISYRTYHIISYLSYHIVSIILYLSSYISYLSYCGWVIVYSRKQNMFFLINVSPHGWALINSPCSKFDVQLQPIGPRRDAWATSRPRLFCRACAGLH